ncbi:MAG: ATP-grasp domain-containing protein [Bdellovibrionales bacterium]|nr:ATP-grasp domain-containing protein [Bdellovibrionales bacterium]
MEIKPLGILGGGQLARMMALEAHRLGITVKILCGRADEPAAQVAPFVLGDPNKPSDLLPFLSSVRVATFESEFYDSAAIEAASKKCGTKVFPQPGLMGVIQDRLSQKELLDRYDIPTSPWRPVGSPQDAVVAYIAMNGKAVFKKRRFGYDGYGTFIVKSENELSALSLQMAAPGLIAERFIRFEREIATVAVRDQKGAVFFYPFVETKQKDARCLWVNGPVKETKALKTLKARISTLLNKENYIGAIGIELFDSEEGLMVNELAPRVHNTAHYTQNAFHMSQFAAHILAVSGERLSEPSPLSRGFAMWNLLGAEARALSEIHPPMMEPNAFFHWYGKIESRPGRKLGHINAIGKSPSDALALAKKMATKAARQLKY